MITLFINIIGFIVINILLAYILKECILSVLPIAVSALTLILYALCLIRHLSWIDYFFVFAIADTILMGYFFRRKIDWPNLKAVVLDPNNIIIAGILLFVYAAAWNRVAMDYDELGVWALEVKTMFYTDGLSLTDMHTSIGYANYIPGQMVIEWWFCHLSPLQFNDGLMYFGYYAVYFFIITPLFVCQKTQNKWWNLVRGLVIIPILFALPSIFCVHEYTMLSVELLVSAVFSTLIYSLFDTQPHTKTYAGIRWIALSILLVLLKSDAILFLVIAYVAAFVLIHIDRMSDRCEQNEAILRVRENSNYRILISGLSFSAATAMTWQMAVRYCHRYGDFSKYRFLDSLIMSGIFSGNLYLTEDQKQYIHSFKETILHQPLHWTTTDFFDLTVISCVILIMLVFYLIYRNQGFKSGRREYVAVSCIAIGSIVLFMLLLLFMYTFIFYEKQYFEPANVIMSLSRYAEPLLMGWSVAGLLVCLNNRKNKLGIIVLVLFLMCPSYTKLYHYFNDLQSNMENTRARYAQGREEFSEFFQEDEDVFGADGQGRILFVYGGEGTRLSNRQFRYLAAPRSICWLDYHDTDNIQETIYDEAIKNVCGFIYFEQVPENVVQTFVNEYNPDPLGDYLYEIR